MRIYWKDVGAVAAGILIAGALVIVTLWIWCEAMGVQP